MAADRPAARGGGAALLARGAGFERPDGSDRVRDLQRRLRRLGFRPGPIDGLFGPLTEAAVIRFQRASRLEPDGLVGPRTAARLGERARGESRGGGGRQERSAALAGGQRSASGAANGRARSSVQGAGRLEAGRAAGAADTAGDGGTEVPDSLWALLAVLALGLAAGILARPGPGQLVSVSPSYVATGVGAQGAFRGRLQALAVRSRFGRERTRLLVADERGPVWVELDQVDTITHESGAGPTVPAAEGATGDARPSGAAGLRVRLTERQRLTRR